VVAFGCDITPTWPANSTSISSQEASDICTKLNNDHFTKKKIVNALTTAVFQEIEPRLQYAISSGLSLVPVGSVQSFLPQKNLFAQEGLHEKWLQRISGYYFAKSLLRDVAFKSSNDVHSDKHNGPSNELKKTHQNVGDLRFTFYYDPIEPLNSIEIGRNINPEILCCKLGAYDEY